MSTLIERDRRICWHPYTQHGTEKDPLAVKSAQGSLLTLEDGRQVIDAISSWWAILHGHGEPSLVTAMEQQVRRLDHVLFAGATHEPAVALAEALVDVTPPGLTRVFYSDNGSTANEVALKMAYQAQRQRGESKRTVFVALEGAYHGDTFGAMAVGDPDPFFLPFEPLLFRSLRIPPKESSLRAVLEEYKGQVAAVIVEPLVQGAAGMVMHRESFLREVRRATRDEGALLIADEVFTGFGRTGSLFACGRADIAPDILCLAKGLTGGLFPLSATLATKQIFEAFLSEDRARAFFHGHTFTGHPVGCAVALASLELCRKRRIGELFEANGERLEAQVRPALENDSRVREVRRLGGIIAVEIRVGDGTEGYLSDMAPRLRQEALARGVLLRPLGPVLYAVPPAGTSFDQLDRIGEVMVDLVKGI